MSKIKGGMHGDMKLFSGNGCPELAAEISKHLKVPLTGRNIIQFPNENIFVQLHESIRGQDVFLIQTTSSPVSHNIMELLIFLDTLKRASPAGRTEVRLVYDPVSQRLGLYLSLLALGVTAGLAGAGRRPNPTRLGGTAVHERTDV